MEILCSYFKWNKFAKTQFWNSYLEERKKKKKTHHAVTKLDFWYVGNLKNSVISWKWGMGSSGNVSTSVTCNGGYLGFNVIEWLNFYLK